MKTNGHIVQSPYSHLLGGISFRSVACENPCRDYYQRSIYSSYTPSSAILTWRNYGKKQIILYLKLLLGTQYTKVYFPICPSICDFSCWEFFPSRP